MNKAEIMRMQKVIGATVDGAWGPKSIAACQKYLKERMPKPHPFPEESQGGAFTDFYGKHGSKTFSPPTKEITLPFTVYYEGSPVKKLHPHVKCADSLLRVFDRLAVAYPTEEARRAAGILTYDGLYNPRKKRGGDSWSMHAWAVAIDLNAGKNGNKAHWPSVAVMPLEVMECFAREGWLAAGAFWSRDAMHFQATRPD